MGKCENLGVWSHEGYLTGEKVFSCVKCLNGRIETFIEGKGFELPCGEFPARGLFEGRVLTRSCVPVAPVIPRVVYAVEASGEMA